MRTLGSQSLRSSVLTALLLFIAGFAVLAAPIGHAQNSASRKAEPGIFVHNVRALTSAVSSQAANQDVGQVQPPSPQSAAPGTPAAPATPKPVELPDGDGKPIATEYCQECHRLTNLVKAHKNEDDWKDTVQTMIDRGARIPDDKVNTLVKYLAKNFGPKPATADPSAGGAATPPPDGSPAAGSASASGTASAPSAKVELPDGDGKEIATENCQACHKLTNLTKAHKSLDDWKDTVQTMIDRGANVPADKVDILVQYLAKNFGPKDQATPASTAPSSTTPAQ